MQGSRAVMGCSASQPRKLPAARGSPSGVKTRSAGAHAQDWRKGLSGGSLGSKQFLARARTVSLETRIIQIKCGRDERALRWEMGAWFQDLVWLLISSVTLDKALYFIKPQFPHL